MATNKQAKTGNKIVVTLNGADVGLVQSIDMQDDYSPEPASGIGDIHVQEYVPSMARHTVNVENMVLYKTNMRAAGASLLNGDDALKGNVFDILVMDKESGGLIRTYRSCSYASGSVQVRKHAIVTSQATFNCLDADGTGA